MENDPKIKALCQLLADLQGPEDVLALFSDMCTRKEVMNMAERLYAAKLLLEGKTYSQIMEQVEISSATLSRVSRCVQYGDGYARLLKKEEQ